jgi:hypothetical protein
MSGAWILSCREDAECLWFLEKSAYVAGPLLTLGATVIEVARIATLMLSEKPCPRWRAIPRSWW